MRWLGPNLSKPVLSVCEIVGDGSLLSRAADWGPVLLKYARRTLPVRYELRAVAVTMFGAPGIRGSLAISP